MEDAGCCETHAQLTCLAEELQQEALDPTLASCCQRDLQEQAQAAKLRARLTVEDRSNERLRAARTVFRRSSPSREAADTAASEQAEDSDEELLANLRVLRLRDLRKQSELRSRLQSAGHGTLCTVPAARALELACEDSRCSVCHWAWEGSEACDALDEHLSTLAHRYPGTRFLRAVVHRDVAHLLQSLGLAGPGLSCFRKGSCVGSCALERVLDEEGGVLEEEVSGWLRSRRALTALGEVPGGSRRQHEEGEREDSSSDEENGDEESWQPACEVCGRRYPHQHIRSSYATGSGDGSEGDDWE